MISVIRINWVDLVGELLQFLELTPFEGIRDTLLEATILVQAILVEDPLEAGEGMLGISISNSNRGTGESMAMFPRIRIGDLQTWELCPILIEIDKPLFHLLRT